MVLATKKRTKATTEESMETEISIVNSENLESTNSMAEYIDALKTSAYLRGWKAAELEYEKYKKMRQDRLKANGKH